MKKLALLVAAGLLLGAGFLSARLAEDEDEAPTMKRYVLGLIYSVEGGEELTTDEVMAIQAGHMANIGRLVETGEMVLAGPCESDGNLRGIFIYDVPTLERAEELVASDPAVAAGTLRVELHGWWATSLLSEMRALSEAGDLHEEAERNHQEHGGEEHGHGDADGGR